MKKITVCLITALLLSTIPMQLKAATETKMATTAVTKPVKSEQARLLLNRLEEINSMDKSKMNSPERKQLRKEVRSIKSQLNDLGEGVYISVGAIIIILLLLIILL